MAVRCSSQLQDRVDSSADAARQFRRGAAFRDFLPALILLAIGLVGLLTASLSGDGRGGQYLVIAAPWSGYGRTIQAIRGADGALAAVGGFGNIAIATSSRRDFADRARQGGAWLVLPSPRLVGCFGLPSEASRS
jgi:hypothetical protein